MCAFDVIVQGVWPPEGLLTTVALVWHIGGVYTSVYSEVTINLERHVAAFVRAFVRTFFRMDSLVLVDPTTGFERLFALSVCAFVRTFFAMHAHMPDEAIGVLEPLITSSEHTQVLDRDRRTHIVPRFKFCGYSGFI
jgi:hypothetical protein